MPSPAFIDDIFDATEIYGLSADYIPILRQANGQRLLRKIKVQNLGLLDEVDSLDAASALVGTEPVAVIQGGVAVQTTVQDIADLASVGASAWGSISGTLSNQADLQTALNLKADLTSPSFTTPTLGVATATSLNKITITAPATGATLTIPDGVTLNAGAGGTLGSNAFTSTAFVAQTTTVNGKALSGNITLGLASADFANQGTTTTLLHGNAAGNPSFGAASLTADVSGILPTANGGTGIAFFTAAGPTVARIYTFPDAAATILTTNAAVTVAQGGTGLATLTANNVMLGNGTSTPLFVAPGTSGNVLTSNGTTWTSAAPAGGGITIGTTTITSGTTTRMLYDLAGVVQEAAGVTTDGTNLSLTGGSLTFTGNISASGLFSTSGIRHKGVAATFTDTTSSGTVATAYTNVFGGNTLVASAATTITNYFTSYFNDPTASTNVTLTNKWAIGADSLKIGTSNQTTISTAGVLTTLAGNLKPVDVTFSGGSLLNGATANVLEQRNGTTAQNLYVYGTFTDASNYGRITLEGGSTFMVLRYGSAGSGVGANILYISNQNNNTSANIQFQTSATNRWMIQGDGHLLANGGDNTYDIGASGANRPRTGYFGTSVRAPRLDVGTVLTFSSTAPTIAAGFGTSPAVAGTAVAFTITVGTGGTDSTGTITLPTATTGWIVQITDITNNASFVTSQTGGTTTTATIQNYSRTTGITTAWTAGDVLRCTAVAY